MTFANRRIVNWMMVGIQFGLFYAARYNLSTMQEALSKAWGVPLAVVSSILQFALLIYGIAVAFNGPLADRLGGKRALLIGASGISLANLAFGCLGLAHGLLQTHTILTMAALVWACNAYFQSFGAISVVKINSRWFSNHDRGKFLGLFGLMIQSGRILANILPPILIAFLPWQYAFWVPAVLVALAIPFTAFFVRNNPEDVGHVAPPTVAVSAEPFWRQGLFWIMIGVALAVGFTRNYVDHFYASHFVRAYGIEFANLRKFPPFLLASTWMPWAACLGVIAMGTLSDRIQSRWAVLAAAGVGVMSCLLLARFWGASGAYQLAICLILYSACIQSIHGLLNGAVSVELSGAAQSGRVVGYLDGTEYLGGFLATPIAASTVGDLNRWTLMPIYSSMMIVLFVGVAYAYLRYKTLRQPQIQAVRAT